MLLNIIHLPHRTDRLQTLEKELAEQSIGEYKMWDGIIHPFFPWTGVAQAHKQIVRHALINREPSVLIAEDDVRFTAPGAFRYYLQNIPGDYDLYLAGIIYGKINECNLVNDFAGRALYMVHERFYESFLSIPEDRHQDRAMKGIGKFVVCEPMVVIQYDGYSDNNKRMMQYAPYLKNRKFYTGSVD